MQGLDIGTCESQRKLRGSGSILDLQHPLLLPGNGGHLKGILTLDRLDDKFGDAVVSQSCPHFCLDIRS